MVAYNVGGHYETHVDFFGPQISAQDERGDRVATMLFYLTDKVLGGATVFPLLDLAVEPQAGSALFWFNTLRDASTGDMNTLHAGCPIVGQGEKWIANV